jgi:WD40 repeat protein
VAAGSGDGSIYVWDVRKGCVAETLRGSRQHPAHDKGEPVYGLGWHPQGAPLVSGDRAGWLVTWR